MDKYKEYEYLLNIDKKQLATSLFNNKELKEAGGTGKATIEEIGEEIEKYDRAAREIENLTNNYIETPMFRVVCSKIKSTLVDQALKIRDALIVATQKWAADTVNHIDNTFRDMQKQIQTVPTNEKELVFIKEFINVSNTVTKDELGELLKAANKHYELLEKYSVVYKQEDIENAFY